MADQIQSGMQSIFDSVFRRRDIVVHAKLTAADVPGWDSLRYVSLIMATEEHFHVTFTDAEIDELANVGDLMTALERKLERKS